MNKRDGDLVGMCFTLLITFVEQWEVTKAFHYKPSEDGSLTLVDNDFFLQLFDKTTSEVVSEVSDEATRLKLQELCREVAGLIETDDCPPTPARWNSIDPNLDFFDCAYDIVEGLSDEEKVAMWEENAGRLKVKPTLERAAEREEYFKQVAKDLHIEEDDEQSAYNAMLQEEMRRALCMVFKQDLHLMATD